MEDDHGVQYTADILVFKGHDHDGIQMPFILIFQVELLSFW